MYSLQLAPTLPSIVSIFIWVLNSLTVRFFKDDPLELFVYENPILLVAKSPLTRIELDPPLISTVSVIAGRLPTISIL